MPKLFVDDDTMRVMIAGFGVVEDGHPLEVPEHVAASVEKNKRIKVRVEREAPKPRFAPKKLKED